MTIRIKFVDRINDHLNGATIVGMGEVGLVKEGRVGTLALGSCVAIILLERSEGIGGIVHAMLPSRKDKRLNQQKYVDSGTDYLISMMIEAGGRMDRLSAALVGGGTIFNFGGELAIGERNTEAARRHLKDRGIPILAEDVGGRRGRSVVLDLKSEEVLVAISKPPVLTSLEVLDFKSKLY